KSVKLLEKFLRSTATVRRDGQVLNIDRSQLVKGDIVLLKAGDAVPADLRLISAESLRIDESTLTGESVEITKTDQPLAQPTGSINAAVNVVFSGSWVRHGEGEGIVIATGDRSVVGGIATLVSTTHHTSTFERNIQQFSGFLVKVVAISLLIVLAVNLLSKSGTIHFSEQLLFALALAISVIPEALPAVTTITFSRGALQLARQHVVVKRLSAIEDLGHIDVLCTDKTGTLTENRPAVASIVTADKRNFLDAILASIPPTVRAGGRESGDPFDSALLEYAKHEGLPLPQGDVLDELPFDAERRRSGTVIRAGNRHRFIVRGAPEVVIELAKHGFENASKEQILAKVEQLGNAGERALAVAVAEVSMPLPTDLASLESNLTFFGIVSFDDPIKPSTRKAIIDAERFGVAVKIVTGDSPAVAASVARKLDLIRSPHEVYSGDQLDAMNPLEFDQAVRTGRVFARMTPIQKFKLIESLERQHLSVGFLGEGINDAPALKLATVSLVVDSASDVARAAADIVLLDKSLQVIVDGIKQGRVIYGNVLKYLKYTLVGNFGNFFAIAGISLIVDYLPMLPVQILLTNILTDFPLVAVAGDNVDDREVLQPQHFRLRELGFLTLTLGMVSSLFDFIFFGIFHGQDPAVIQTLWFTCSILTELALIFSIRTVMPFNRVKLPSATLAGLTIAAAGFAILVPFSPLGHDIFHFITPTARQMLIIAGIVSTYFILTETVKRLYYRQYQVHPA
ncbi:MAG: HAD-IC family P-type ATPase, partial [Candidatus Kerfeldbacteria bacterium]|nr:HAD-IC family P-type ATPase [Candidatus Kerfeldbacteria bacterium]